MPNADCHYGDHYYNGNGATCSDCGFFNAPLLNWLREEKALKEGRHHGFHYHLTTAKAEACKNKIHDEQKCANSGGCRLHEPSQEWEEQQNIGLYI
jgi:hypothetical protein